MRKIFESAFSGKNGHCVKRLGQFMQKLEVILPLDAERLLMPSFLPQTEDSACIVLHRDEQGTAALGKSEDISTFEQKSLVRYYILPFVPQDFFPRLIARVTGSLIRKEFGDKLVAFLAGNQKLEGTLNWLCWRSGIKLVWNQLEILTVTAMTFPLNVKRTTYNISSSGPKKVERQHGVEINVAILPQDIFNGKLDAITTITTSLSTWLLQQAVQYIESVFNDWYETFGRSRGFELSLINSASPCPHCTSSNNTPQGPEEMQQQYMFSSIFCARVVTENKELMCPTHGKVPMIDVAPDLVRQDK